MLTSFYLHKKSSVVCIKTRSTPASFLFKGLVTEHRSVKWSICIVSFVQITNYDTECAQLAWDKGSVQRNLAKFIDWELTTKSSGTSK